MKRIAILTSGGDAPGMNAAIRAAVRTAIENGADVVGVRNGYAGLLREEYVPLTARDVSGIIEHAGTVLGSARSQEFRSETGVMNAIRSLEDHAISGLIVIGDRTSAGRRDRTTDRP